MSTSSCPNTKDNEQLDHMREEREKTYEETFTRLLKEWSIGVMWDGTARSMIDAACKVNFKKVLAKVMRSVADELEKEQDWDRLEEGGGDNGSQSKPDNSGDSA